MMVNQLIKELERVKDKNRKVFFFHEEFKGDFYDEMLKPIDDVIDDYGNDHIILGESLPLKLYTSDGRYR